MKGLMVLFCQCQHYYCHLLPSAPPSSSRVVSFDVNLYSSFLSLSMISSITFFSSSFIVHVSLASPLLASVTCYTILISFHISCSSHPFAPYFLLWHLLPVYGIFQNLIFVFLLISFHSLLLSRPIFLFSYSFNSSPCYK